MKNAPISVFCSYLILSLHSLKYPNYFLVFVCCLLVGPPVDLKGQHRDSTATADTSYQSKVLLLPAIGSSPETGFFFGGVAVPQFKVGAAGPDTRSSSILISAIYTVKNQILTSFIPDIFFPGETWVFNGRYFANYFPESYWGIGPHTDDEEEITALYTQVNLEQNALKKVGKGLFVGPYIKWSKLYNISFEDDGDKINSSDIPGGDGSTSAGLGLTARWDLRNSNMTPTRNHFLEFLILVNSSWLDSSHSYISYLLDGRRYYQLQGNGRSVLALQALARLTSGTPSFRDLSMLGGDMINRGYYEGRYRDQNAAQIQLELRQKVKGRFGFTVFAATGEVWNRMENISFDNYKWTAGAGLRININKDDPTNLRIDFGISKESTGFYLQFGEAF